VRSVKFLFLPPEHDPDSFIREHGREEFLRYTRQAVPLSVFLLEAAAEDCDLATAEGRSRMVSAAQPLWSAMPEGALKRQLFGELAERSQVGAHELAELWKLPRATGERRRQPREPRAYGAGVRRAIKPKAVAFAETVARLVLRHSTAWEQLSQRDHEVLCGLQAPLGDLFSWLDATTHELGGQPWAALQVGLQGQAFQPLAEQLMAYDESQPLGRVVEYVDTTERDLRLSMLEIHLDLAASAIEAASQLPQTDPARFARLLELSRAQQDLLQQKRTLRP
ncbi:MAG TPA: DNA primase, partial [Ramlibacter sp.]|nr:DNA primase [Ramlibacter sp.]